jgi:hypothetical protein
MGIWWLQRYSGMMCLVSENARSNSAPCSGRAFRTATSRTILAHLLLDACLLLNYRLGNQAIAKLSTKLPSGKRTRSLKLPSSKKPNFEYKRIARLLVARTSNSILLTRGVR